MVTVEWDIEKFYKYVRQIIQEVKPRGQVVVESDLLLPISKGYQENLDRTLFVHYQRKKDLFGEGERMSLSSLIVDMQNKYLTLLEDNALNQVGDTD